MPPRPDRETEERLGQFRNARNLRQHIAVQRGRMRFPLPKEVTMPRQDIAPIVKVERMLEALLKGSNHIHWIGGYVYGRTSNDEPFVILYPADPRLQEKAVRVYPHDFKKLPDFIPTDNIEGETDANPNKEKAMKRGIYNFCPLFQIVTYDGKDTQMGPEKRFGHVLAITDKMPDTAVANGTTAPPTAPPAAPPPAPKQTAPTQTAPNVSAEEQAFLTAVQKMNPLYPDWTTVRVIALKVAEGWQHGRDPMLDIAMSNALAKYATTRADLEAEKKDRAAAHEAGLKAAIEAFAKLRAST